MDGYTAWGIATRGRRAVLSVGLTWALALSVLWGVAPLAGASWVAVGGLLVIAAGYAVLVPALRHPRSRQPSWLPLVSLCAIPVALAVLWAH